MTFIKYIRCPGMIFIQLFNWFHKFSSGEKLQKVVGHSQNRSKMNYFERGWRWFQLFFIDFQLFYFLTRITPDLRQFRKINNDGQEFNQFREILCRLHTTDNNNLIVKTVIRHLFALIESIHTIYRLIVHQQNNYRK